MFLNDQQTLTNTRVNTVLLYNVDILCDRHATIILLHVCPLTHMVYILPYRLGLVTSAYVILPCVYVDISTHLLLYAYHTSLYSGPLFISDCVSYSS